MLPVSFAPLEGITDTIFRQVHHECFPGIGAYYVPFISPTTDHRFQPKQWRSVSPELNAGVPTVPQLLVKTPELLRWGLETLRDAGWKTINLNAGCPSGTVTAKGKGSGLLRDTDNLRHLLDEGCRVEGVRLSVKTRIGFDSASDWEKILAVYKDYPLESLIVHPRTKEMFYTGTPDAEAYALTKGCSFPVIWNGDLFHARELRETEQAFPHTAGFMCGRGLIANPALAREYAGGEALTLGDLKRFHDALLERYEAQYPEIQALGRMREIMLHIICCFDADKKIKKNLCKARHLDEFEEAVRALWDCPMHEAPGFTPPDSGWGAKKKH